MSLSNNKDLMRQIIIDHYDSPINKIEENQIANYDNYKQYHNKSATCIDDIKVYVLFDKDLIKDVKFFGIGCAISTASTDILSQAIKNKTKQQALDIINNYKNMINNEPYNEDILNELIAFSDIYKQQNRIKCSLIGINAIERIINESNE